MKAFVLVHVRPGAVPEVTKNMRRLSGVIEANMTFGPYDVVAIVQADDIAHLGQLIAGNIQPIPGVVDTMTCLVAD